MGVVVWGCVQPAVGQQSIQIRSDFDHGSMGVLKQTEPGVFKGQTMHFIKKDQIGNQYYWFYIKVLHAGKKSVTIELSNMQGVYRGGPHLVYTDYTQPVISNDGEEWKRITEVRYDENDRMFTFSFTPSSDTAWVAYAHPYSYGRLQQMTDTLDSSELVTTETIGTSVDDRSLTLIKISGSEDREESKKNVFITGMQHAGEDAGGYLIEGLIRFLLSGNNRASSVLDKCNFYLIPMMNPDGIFYGTSRYNWNMEDLNADWDDGWTDTTDTTTEPVVAAVKEWTELFTRDHTIDLFMDVHNHSQKNRRNVFVHPRESFREFVEINSELWDVEGVNSDFDGSVVWYMDKKYAIPAATIELTQSHPGDGRYLDIKDYHTYGAGLGKAIGRYFSE